MYVSSDQKLWDKHLNSVLFAYRVFPSEVTGESPFYMLYGREPLLHMDTALLPPREMTPSVACRNSKKNRRRKHTTGATKDEITP